MAPTDRFRPRKQPRQQRALETRQAILEAAARVFAEYGYAAGTTNRIAEAADLSIGSLYQYFPNKDAILSALTDAHVDAGTALLRDRTATGLPESLEDLLRLFVRATIDNHRDDTRLHRVLFEEALAHRPCWTGYTTPKRMPSALQKPCWTAALTLRCPIPGLRHVWSSRPSSR